jgi:hypothetical protein
MPVALAVPFTPSYTVSTRASEKPTGFKVHTVEWNGNAKVRVTGLGAGQSVKVGFIQVVKAYEIKIEYDTAFVEWKLPSTPMCDTDPATDAPWYEASPVPVGAGVSPVVNGPTPPAGTLVVAAISDRPTMRISWTDAGGAPPNDKARRVRRKQTFQTWLVAHDQSLPLNAANLTVLHCFSYSIDQVVTVSFTKATGAPNPVGQRCKVELGASTQASKPTTYTTAPFPKIPAAAFVQACPNTSQVSTRTAKI